MFLQNSSRPFLLNVINAQYICRMFARYERNGQLPIKGGVSEERCSHCMKRLCRKAECRKPGAERGLVWGRGNRGGERGLTARQRLDSVKIMADGPRCQRRKQTQPRRNNGESRRLKSDRTHWNEGQKSCFNLFFQLRVV